MMDLGSFYRIPKAKGEAQGRQKRIMQQDEVCVSVFAIAEIHAMQGRHNHIAFYGTQLHCGEGLGVDSAHVHDNTLSCGNCLATYEEML